MKDFTLALIQHSSPVGQRDKNIETTISWTKRAKKKGAALACFPELNITGHAGHSSMVSQAEPVPEGPSVQALCEVADDLDMHISAGIAEDERGIHYNTQFLVGPNGYIGKQRKVHLSGDEYFYFRHGTDLPVLDTGLGRIGTIICYDNLFPEISRCMAIDGAELLLAPHAARIGKWPKVPSAQRKAVQNMKKPWSMTHSCRAYDNGCYVALCNTAGRSAVGIKRVEANHAGTCLVFDPRGELVAESRSRDIRDEMLLVQIDGKAVGARRSVACFNLQTRRPEVFKAITRPTA